MKKLETMTELRELFKLAAKPATGEVTWHMIPIMWSRRQ
jgi:hypothetical protein